MTAKNTIKAKAISKTELARDYSAALRKAFNSMIKAFDKRVKDGNFSQDDIAKLLDIDKGLVSRRLNGTKNLTLRTLSSMASAMGCYLIINFSPYEDRVPQNKQWRDDCQPPLGATPSTVSISGFNPTSALHN